MSKTKLYSQIFCAACWGFTSAAISKLNGYSLTTMISITVVGCLVISILFALIKEK
jgi:hypothetical protein